MIIFRRRIPFFILILLMVLPSCGVNNSLKTNLIRSESPDPDPTPTPPSSPCPANYIRVPALSPYTNEDFCIAKYEMKIQGQSNGDQVYNSAFVAESRADGTPWVEVTLLQAKEECTQLGAGYDLMTNAEWQSTARNVEQVAWNWSGATVGSAAGLSRSTGMTAGVAASVDNDSCAGTGATCDLDTWSDRRRVHKLSNGEYVWDLGGNVAERMKDDNNYFVGNTTIAQMTTAAVKRLFGPAGNYAALNSEPYGGLGEAIANSNNNDSVVRSGAWGPGNVGALNAGIFSLNTVAPPTGNDDSIGFRCAYHITAGSAVKSIFQSYYDPITEVTADPAALELGVHFIPEVNGKISAIRFYRGAVNVSGYTVTLWTNGGAVITSASGSDGTIPGWQQIDLPTPISVTAGTTYVASYYTSNGAYASENNGFNTPYVNLGFITAPIGAGVYKMGAGFPASSFSNSNYFVDVIFTPD